MKCWVRLRIATIALYCAVPVLAHADTFYNLSGTLVDKGTISGTIGFNPSTGLVDAGNFTVVDINANNFTTNKTGTFTFTSTPAVFPGTTDSSFSFMANSTTSGQFVLTLPGAFPMTGYAGGELCSVAFPCGSDKSFFAATIGLGSFYMSPVQEASLTPVATTPEPESFVLVGSGLAALVGVLRRRLAPTMRGLTRSR